MSTEEVVESMKEEIEKWKMCLKEKEKLLADCKRKLVKSELSDMNERLEKRVRSLTKQLK